MDLFEDLPQMSESDKDTGIEFSVLKGEFIFTYDKSDE